MMSNIILPLKENSLFKRAMKCYENKQYKNGVKFVNQILSNPKFVEHGETLAVKGLLFYCLGKREEAHELVKRGLKADLKSYLCWHTYGLLHRSEKNFEEAIKCFRNALRWDSTNTQILQDLSVLQLQVRDMEGFLDTRAKMFYVAPTQRAAWAGYAVAYHLNKDYDTCLHILDTFRKTLTTSYDNYSLIEYSELLLYENFVIEESCNIAGALDHLIWYQIHIFDKVAVLENFSRFYIMLRNYKEAETYIQQLLVRNPDNCTYYGWLFEVLGLKTDEEKYEALNNLLKTLPSTRLPRRLILDFTHGDKFSQEIAIYLRKELRRGVPSLFVDIRFLYKDLEKVYVIENLVLNYKQYLLNCGALVEGSTDLEPPTTLLWIYYLLAQHYCFLKNTDKALEYIDLAISHTPTLPDLYITKAKIFKKAGNLELASDWIMEARALDPSDRFINTKCACYHFKANRIKLAEEITSLFAPDIANVFNSLSEMQCIWYLLESALAYERLAMYGEALMRCHEIDRHFVQFYQDQIDFHSYCLRGMTLKPYIYLLRYEEDIKGHIFYKKTAQCAIRIYLKLHDTPKQPEQSETVKEESSLTSSELRKMKNKERKARKKAALKDEEKEETKPKLKVAEKSSCSHEESAAEFYKNTSTPLEDALKFLMSLKTVSYQDIAIHLWGFEIYYRKGKLLLMLRTIKQAYSIQSDNSFLHEMIVRFTLLYLKHKSENTLSSQIREVIDKQMDSIWRGRTPSQMNEDFINECGFSLPALIQIARSMYLIDNSKKSEALELCTRLEGNVKDVSVDDCTRVLSYMRSGVFGECKSETDAYILKCHEKFPLAISFLPTEHSETQVI